MNLEFTKATDSEHEIELESTLVSVSWRTGAAIAGQTTGFEITTAFVGQGAPINVTGQTTGGTDLGKVKGVVKNNRFIGEFALPEDLERGDEAYFEASLSQNGLDGESGRIPVHPPILCSNLRWDPSEARRGDLVTLAAEIKGLADATEVVVVIYEYDANGAHDKIAELPASVTGQKLELQWAYEYHEDTDELPTQEEMEEYGGNYTAPAYFFTIKFQGCELGRSDEPALLRFKDWIELECENPFGDPASEADYTLTLPDGSERSGQLNSDGKALIEGVPPGPCSVEVTFPEEE